MQRWIPIAAILAVPWAAAIAGQREEDAFRLAYAKLSFASRIGAAIGAPDAKDNPIQVVISDLRSGSFEEIRYKPGRESLPVPEGPLLNVTPGTWELRGEKDVRPVFRVRLLTASWAPPRDWPLRDWSMILEQGLSVNYPGVLFTAYVSGTIHLRFEGREKVYKAMLLFGEGGDRRQKLVPVDYTVGPAMTAVMEESWYPEGVGRTPAALAKPAGVARCVYDAVDPRICCDLSALACYFK